MKYSKITLYYDCTLITFLITFLIPLTLMPYVMTLITLYYDFRWHCDFDYVILWLYFSSSSGLSLAIKALIFLSRFLTKVLRLFYRISHASSLDYFINPIQKKVSLTCKIDFINHLSIFAERKIIWFLNKERVTKMNHSVFRYNDNYDFR